MSNQDVLGDLQKAIDEGHPGLTLVMDSGNEHHVYKGSMDFENGVIVVDYGTRADTLDPEKVESFYWDYEEAKPD